MHGDEPGRSTHKFHYPMSLRHVTLWAKEKIYEDIECKGECM